MSLFVINNTLPITRTYSVITQIQGRYSKRVTKSFSASTYAVYSKGDALYTAIHTYRSTLYVRRVIPVTLYPIIRRSCFVDFWFFRRELSVREIPQISNETLIFETLQYDRERESSATITTIILMQFGLPCMRF